MAYAQRMVGAILARGQYDWQKRAGQIKGRSFDVVSAPPCCVQRAIASTALVVKQTGLNLRQHRTAEQQIATANNRPITYVVEACLTLSKLTQAHGAMRAGSISAEV